MTILKVMLYSGYLKKMEMWWFQDIRMFDNQTSFCSWTPNTFFKDEEACKANFYSCEDSLLITGSCSFRLVHVGLIKL